MRPHAPRVRTSRERAGTAAAAASDSLPHEPGDCRSDSDDNNNLDSNNDNNNDSPSQSSSPSFERTFPRYRIDVQAAPAAQANHHNNPWQAAWKAMIRPPWQAPARDAAALASRYPATTTTGNNTTVVALHDDDSTGVAALAVLWRAAASLTEAECRVTGSEPTNHHNTHKHDDDDSPDQQKTTTTTTTDEQRAVLVVLPQAAPRVLQHFCDIFTWGLATLLPLDAEDDAVVWQVDYVPEHQAVHLKRTCRSSSRSDSSTYSTYNTAIPPAANSPATTTWQPDEINQHTQAWVTRVLVKLGICPFTKSATRSGQGLAHVGVPVANIAYHATNASHFIALQADTWDKIRDMLDAGPTEISSILLAAPAYDANLTTWAGPIFAMLEAGVVAASAEDAVGVVCFHPLYATPDGTTWPGFGHMHSVPRLTTWVTNEINQALKPKRKGRSQANKTTPAAAPPTPLTREEIAAGGAWQRRTPHATINVLRADQLAAAEQSRDSASLYTRNIRICLAQGNERLQEDLDRERGCPLELF
jgi:hypothetical protein